MKRIPYKSQLMKVAIKSNHHQHPMAAAIISGGKIVSMHTNNNHIHAEQAVINRSWRSGAEGCTLVVIRVKADGGLGMAKPCLDCMQRIKEAGIKKVLFTNADGVVCELKVQDRSVVQHKKLMAYHFVRPDRNKRTTNRYD